eukprot:EC823286.1.p3 GENE.EC823286.1~~EC823286.1.p3  ORF type:complete len:85 (+),score=15.82 EC823286.1:63-317(+)
MNNNIDIDNWIEKIKKLETLNEVQTKKLCNMVKNILIEESNLQPVKSPVNICGDIHGQFYDLLELFQSRRFLTRTQLHFHGRLC